MSLPVGFGQKLPKLIRLTLVNNQLTSLPDGFGHALSVPSLKFLKLHNNQLTSLPDGFERVLSNLPNLKWISIFSSNNEIANIINIYTKNPNNNIQKVYTQLEELLKSNPARSVPQSLLQELQISNIYFIDNYTDITVCNTHACFGR